MTLALDKEVLITMYLKMLRIRAFEEHVDSLFAQRKIWGTCHLSVGQEAVAVGVIQALRPEDYIISNHRGHGHSIAKGADIRRMMAELMGKQTGYCLGLGGSMHIAEFEIGNLGANGVVGGGIPISVGVALALKMKKRSKVVVCFFGDGAANQGACHEAMNMASVMKVPVIFVCENNMYGMSMHVKKAFTIQDIAQRASAYGMPGKVVDGNDVLAVYEAAREAAEWCRSGMGPILLECKTYRWKGHSKSDANLYRTKEEIEYWKRNCPIERFEGCLMAEGIISEQDAVELKKQVESEIREAIEFALISPELPFEQLNELVYA